MKLKGAPSKLKFKRELRSNMTEPERRLWNLIRSKQLNGFKFRRQHGIGPFIIDFYCAEKSLAIEVDGDSHGEEDQSARDSERTGFLNELGVSVVRYTNSEIMSDLDGVLNDILTKLTS